ncbi:MAG: hypothetical protein ACKO96_39230, partial [Flammeovirgaceae bacterium]
MNNFELTNNPDPKDYFTIDELSKDFMMSYNAMRHLEKTNGIRPIKFTLLNFTSKYKKNIFLK